MQDDHHQDRSLELRPISNPHRLLRTNPERKGLDLSFNPRTGDSIATIKRGHDSVFLDPPPMHNPTSNKNVGDWECATMTEENNSGVITQMVMGSKRVLLSPIHAPYHHSRRRRRKQFPADHSALTDEKMTFAEGERYTMRDRSVQLP